MRPMPTAAAPARIEDPVRVARNADAGLRVAALQGGEAGLQRVGDRLPGGRACECLVGGDAAGRRGHVEPAAETGAGFLGGLQRDGRGDEQYRVGRVGEGGREREAGGQKVK